MKSTLPALLEKLRALKPELRERFGVSAIAVFGSHVRAQAGPESDLDLLVDFAPGARPTYFSLAELEIFLGSALAMKVDAVAREELNPRLEPYITSELVAA
jgi:predicted nucleotidyltransferase